jgi:hypothetical protein
MSALPLDAVKNSLGTIFDACWVTTAEVALDRNFSLRVHEDGVEWTFRDAEATTVAQVLTDHHDAGFIIPRDRFSWTCFDAWSR